MATAVKELASYFDEDWSQPAPVTTSQPAKEQLPEKRGGASNLTPWKKGQTGNPGGRKKYQPITEAIRSELEREMPGADGKTVAQALAKRLIAIAAGKGKDAIRALEVILERAEGKVVQRQELSGVDGEPMKFETVGSREEAEAKIAALLILAQERQRENVTDARQPTTIEGTVVPVTIPAPAAQPVPLPLADIPMQPFADSSNVAAAGYDPVGRTLLVQYLNGGHYFWREIPPGEYQALRAAGSPGGYLKGIETRYGLGTKIDPVELKSQPVPGGKPSLDLSW
jgi:hypothetical protein